MKPCDKDQMQQALREGACQVVDVREPGEYRSGHWDGAVNIPLSELKKGALGLQKEKPVILICQSGARAGQAAARLEDWGFGDVRVLQGGMQAWASESCCASAGKRNIWAMDRQVRLAAGALMLAGIVLGWAVNAWFLVLAAFVASGLVFSAVTDTCGMAMLLAKMPWNR